VKLAERTGAVAPSDHVRHTYAAAEGVIDEALAALADAVAHAER